MKNEEKKSYRRAAFSLPSGSKMRPRGDVRMNRRGRKDGEKIRGQSCLSLKGEDPLKILKRSLRPTKPTNPTAWKRKKRGKKFRFNIWVGE